MNSLPSAKDIALSPFCYVKLHFRVVSEHVSVITKHLMDK